MKQTNSINPSLLSLEEIVQASPVPTFVLDAQHQIVHWNRACEQILKVPASQMLGTRDQWKPFYPSKRPVMADLVISGDIENSIGDYYEGKYHHSTVVPGSYEAEDFFPDIGDGVWLYFSASAIHDDQGNVIGAIETLQDITLRNNAVLSEQKALEKLRLSHDRLRTVIEHFPFAVVVFNQQAELIYYNSRFTQMVDLPAEFISREGITLEQIYQHNLERGEYISEETLHQAEALIEHVKNAETMSMERTRPNGIVLDIRGTPIPDGYVISFTDITARKGIEHRIQQLLLEFQLIFQNAQVGIARLRDRKILTCNPKLAEILGYENPDELIGQSTEILYPDHQSWVDDGKQLYSETEFRQRIEQEVSYQRRDGSSVNVMRAGQMIDQSDKHDAIWTFMDISDRLKAESALAMKHQELQSVLDAAHEVSVIATTVDGTIRIFNRGAEQMLGYQADEVVGIETPMLIHVESEVEQRRHELEQELCKSLTPFETFVYKARIEGAETRDWHYVRKDGRQLEVSLVVTSVRSPGGQIVGYLGLARDITEQREAEVALIHLNNELEQRVTERTADLQLALEKVKHTQAELARADRMAALGSLVAGVSHELNTPIGNCVTVSSTLLEQTREISTKIHSGQLKRSQLIGYLDSTLHACELMLNGTRKAERLVGEFKQVATDQSGEQRRRFDLEEVVSSLLSLFLPTLRKRDVELSLALEPGVEMDSYPGLLEQVINNLINNAMLHGFDGDSGSILISSALEGDSVRVEVTDDGKGIPDDEAKLIFDPFFTTKLGSGGSGLGLNIVYNIVTGPLGGEIEVLSHPGQGTRIQLLIPRSAPMANNDESQPPMQIQPNRND